MTYDEAVIKRDEFNKTHSIGKTYTTRITNKLSQKIVLRSEAYIGTLASGEYVIFIQADNRYYGKNQPLGLYFDHINICAIDFVGELPLWSNNK